MYNLNFSHNKKMEDDLVKQHKHNTKKIKSSEKQKQNMSDEISIETVKKKKIFLKTT